MLECGGGGGVGGGYKGNIIKGLHNSIVCCTLRLLFCVCKSPAVQGGKTPLQRPKKSPAEKIFPGQFSATMCRGDGKLAESVQRFAKSVRLAL